MTNNTPLSDKRFTPAKNCGDFSPCEPIAFTHTFCKRRNRLCPGTKFHFPHNAPRFRHGAVSRTGTGRDTAETLF
ncbi:hypothetical protein DWW79_08750 [Alistipes sp. AF17-16]|nr:hypothetical protein DWW79_08750 [Alistipes sp. AF17-16]